MAQPCTGDHPPRSLPVLHRARQGLTCRFRCGDACAKREPNRSANPYFGEVLGAVLDRRGVLRAGAVLGLAGGAVAVGGPALAAAATPGPPVAPAPSPAPYGLDYATVPPNTDDAVRVPGGYAQNVVVRWGDPILPGAPEFDFDHQTAAAQARQFGYNNDFCGILLLEGPLRRWVLFSNHEYTIEPLMFRDYDAEAPTEEQVRIGLAAHGHSVVEIVRDREGRMTVDVQGPRNRRITGSTEFLLDGPAAGSPLLRTSADPTGTLVLGTFNNCAGGTTPWGTFLSGEENVDQYFANAPADPRLARYGFEPGPSERGWETVERRFDLAQEPNEANRFGWVVEVDPHDPHSRPVKHTALGRFKHEGATIRLSKEGHAVAYMGDDERFDYVYKFVSSATMRKGQSRRAREHNLSLLSDGTLYVARFTGDGAEDGEYDGSGEWIKLAAGSTSFVPGMTAEEVYVFTREAGDKVGATKMDRPEDVEPNPANGHVFLALTNNTDRGKAGKAGPDEANPRADNKHGHVIELVEADDDPTGTSFTWSILLVCGDPADPSTYFGGFDKSQVSPITSPDNLAFDTHGNLWISTDSSQALEQNDGLFGVSLTGETRGRTTQFLSVPIGAETCGPVVTDDFVLVSVQHPGDVDDASPDRPGSHWPDGGSAQPRPAVVNVYREDRGRIGI
ncbi:PhoX family protein [Pseudonocardia oroxyli]|uniref:Phosphatase n=1 Tax=Pseudonocardia oroxyli TaxID=366584 RepID=A0A1G7NAS7_PSEOR|nr:PhoX family phosphatase [Pseudonocardia oroxyli]SDF71195.1 hypothetical protein SAMN05216377_106188 [Pseudonocardia oroxyli]